MIALTLAEAAGIAVVSCAYAAGERGMVAHDGAAVLAAGAVEGLFLGSAQAIGLRPLGVRTGAWLGLTVLAAVLGYALSLLGQAGRDAPSHAAFDPPLWLMAAAGGGIGLGMGAVMGLVQSPALPGSVSRWRWSLANMAGWIPAMAAIMAAAGLAGAAWPLWQVALLGGASGAVAGFCVALATWLALRPASIGPMAPGQAGA